eukprot:gnl/Dysnectes_brevis/3790_a4874_837.p1 GENE.gnl/Dysnectes_brevis/3790_a4874_837~~gnl/Dysnectes_brevis/3790_a4874_837.p1  ORF type:complete len:426 (-),score=9.06 gnl/Dysnectes_brevis/3790_a4874_837:23-1300(-)
MQERITSLYSKHQHDTASLYSTYSRNPPPFKSIDSFHIAIKQHDLFPTDIAAQITSESLRNISNANPTAGGPSQTQLIRTTTTKQSTSISKIQQKPDPSQLHQIVRHRTRHPPTPPHIPWLLSEVIVAHQGWINDIQIDITNELFFTCSNDNTIRAFHLASRKPRLTLTGHVGAIRSLAISPRSPFLFSGGDDKDIKLWDLEYNRELRHFHGHRSAVHSLALHPRLGLLVSGGRDCSVRGWDVRTSKQVLFMEGHTAAVSSLHCFPTDPQVVSGSYDNTVRAWDLRTVQSSNIRASVIRTEHAKGIRSIIEHPKHNAFLTVAGDGARRWRLPTVSPMGQLDAKPSPYGKGAISENLVAIPSEDGSLVFHDWKTGALLQTIRPPARRGSLEGENGLLCARFDRSGSRLLVGCVDKTVKVFQRVEQQ